MIDALMAIAVCADVRIDVVDVDAEESLLARWDELVPVLLDDAGEMLCHYHLDVRGVTAYLSRFPLKSAD